MWSYSRAFARTSQHARAHYPLRECYRRPLSAVYSRVVARTPHCAHPPPLSAKRTTEPCHSRLLEANVNFSAIFRVTARWISSLQSCSTPTVVIRPPDKFREGLATSKGCSLSRRYAEYRRAPARSLLTKSRPLSSSERPHSSPAPPAIRVSTFHS